MTLGHLGPYELVERLAVGGMAEVFRARGGPKRGSVPPGDIVIKRMLPHLRDEAEFVELFVEEARIVKTLKHPNIVRVFDFGEVDGQLFLAMELVDGLDGYRLARRAGLRGTTVPWDLALSIGIEVLAALEYVHGLAAGPVLHRDISPSNIYISRQGEVKLGDFGVARMRPRDARTPHTGDRTPARGKLSYLAPEQVEGKSADHRADLFSTAVVLVELLTGQPLFAGGSELDVLLRIREGDLVRLKAAETLLPVGLMPVLEKALARSPADRYSGAGPFASGLRGVLQRHGKSPGAHDLGRFVSALSEDVPLGERVGYGDEPEVFVEGRRVSGAPDAEPATPTVPPPEFLVRNARGDLRGPIPYAMLVEWLATGRLGAEDEISKDGRVFTMVRDVPEMRRHLPHGSGARPMPRPVSTSGGTFAERGFVGVLGLLAARKQTGLLECVHPPMQKDVFFRDGNPTLVNSNLADELLGEYLVSRGVLRRGELDMALAVLPKFDGKLGDTLVALGLVEPIALVRFIGQQRRQKLIDLFRWRKGRFEFLPGVPSPDEGFVLNLDPGDIIVEGLRSGYTDEELVERTSAGRSGETLVVPVAAPEAPITAFHVPDAYREIIRSVRGPVRAADLLADHQRRGPDALKDARRALLFGLEVGLLAWA